MYKFLYCSSRCFITVYTKGFISDTAIGKQVLYFDKRNAVVDLELSKGGKVRLQYAQVDLDVGVSYDAGEEKAKIEAELAARAEAQRAEAEAEAQRVAAAAAAESERRAAEFAAKEQARLAEEEAARLAELAAQADAEEAERIRAEAEEKRIAAEAEAARLKAVQAEMARAEAAAREAERIAAEEAERERAKFKFDNSTVRIECVAVKLALGQNRPDQFPGGIYTHENDSNEERWILLKAGGGEKIEYYIQSSSNSKYLGYNGSTGGWKGPEALYVHPNQSINETWIFCENDDGSYRISNKAFPNLALGSWDKGGGDNKYENVYMHSSDSENERWMISIIS